MSTPKLCKRCGTYLLDHRDFKLQHQGWKYCPSCGWACDKEGYNLVDKKPTEKEEENKGGDS
jgi:uncharacterized Zn finger protein (UPF0148 family)